MAGPYDPAVSGVAWRGFISLRDLSTPGSFKANPTIAAGDFKVSIDGAALNNLTTLPSVAPAGSIWVQVDLSASEMTGDNILIQCIDQTSPKEWADFAFEIQTASLAYGALQPTVAGRKLDVSAGGEAGLDWANVGSPGTTVGLSGTTIATSQVVASVTGDVGGNLTGSIGSLALQAKTDTGNGVWNAATSTHVAAGSFGLLIGTDLDATISSRTKPADTQARVTLVDTVTTYTGNTPQTGDAYARLGAPANGSIAADLAEIEAETDGIAAIPTNPYTGTPPTVAQIATGIFQDTTPGDFTVAGSIGKTLGGCLGTSVFSAAGGVKLADGVTHGGATALFNLQQFLINNPSGIAFSCISAADDAVLFSTTFNGNAAGLHVRNTNFSGEVGFGIKAEGGVADISCNASGVLNGDLLGRVLGEDDISTLAFIGIGVQADVEQWKGATAPANTGDAFARIGAAGAGLTALGDTRVANLDATITSRTKPADTQARVTLVDTVTTYTGNTPQTGDSYARLGIPAGASIAADIAEVEAETDNITAIPTNPLLTSDSRLNHLDADISTRLPTSSYTAPDNADIVTAAAAAASAAISSAAVKLQTDKLTFDGSNNVLSTPQTAVALSSAGLDAIPMTAPTGSASTFREAIVQLWRRFFKKTTKSNTQIKTYADDNTTVLTTQTIVTGGTQEVDAAS